MPPGTKLLVGVLVEAADVRPHHLDAEYLEEEVAADGKPQEIPSGNVVASPVADEVSRTHTGAPANYERPSQLAQIFVSGHSRQVPIVGMHFSVSEWRGRTSLVIVGEVCVDGHNIDVLILLHPKGLLHVVAPSEVGWLVHVQPNTRKIDTFVQSLQLPLPEKSGIGVQVVDEVHCPRPHLPSVVFIRVYGVFEEDVHFLAF